jgi:hypothetical protein
LIAVAATPAQAQDEPGFDIKTEEFKLKCKDGKLKGEGDLKMAILSTCDFDACEAICEFLKDGGQFYAYNDDTFAGSAPVDSKCKDVNNDGLEDYQFKFLVKDLVCDGVLEKETTVLHGIFVDAQGTLYPIGPAEIDDCYTQAQEKADCDKECEKDDDDSDDCEESKDDDDCTTDTDDSDDCEPSHDDDDCDTGGDADDSDDCEEQKDDDDCEQADVDDSDQCEKSDDDDDCEEECEDCTPPFATGQTGVPVDVDVKTEEFEIECEKGKLEGEGDLKIAFLSTCEFDACKEIDENEIYISTDKVIYACPVAVKCKDVNCDGLDDLQAKFLVEDLVCLGVLTQDSTAVLAYGFSCDGQYIYFDDATIDDYYEQATEKADCADDCDDSDDCDKDDDDCDDDDCDDDDDDCDRDDDDDDCDKDEDDDDCDVPAQM